MMLLVVNKSSWHAVGAAIGVTLTQPRSRGTIRLASRDPGVLPDVRFWMLTDPLDFEHMVEGFRLAPELMRDSRVRPLRHELFAAGYSGVVRRLNKPGIVDEVVTRMLTEGLDGPDLVRRTMINYGIAGGDADENRMGGEQWLETTIRRHAFGTYHPSGTCRLGSADDPGAVVDPDLGVFGVDGLSVVDASIMPTVTRGNTNIPSP